jgi:hypothetical protein
MKINTLPCIACGLSLVSILASSILASTGCQTEGQKEGENATVKEIALPDTLLEPKVIRSKSGRLVITLEAAPSPDPGGRREFQVQCL